MDHPIYFIFGCHSHQPTGNFDHVFQDAYERAYKPFLDVFEQYPGINVTLHFTGPLLDWILANEPKFLGRLRELAHAGRVEMMGGAYYEPLICAIPERDSIEQIQRMIAFCEKHFGAPPRGMWLAERVWEPHMPRILAQAGVEYTALDDAHFQYSGHSADSLFGYYVTEDEGYAVKVFPILKQLRYNIPFRQVHETIEYLRRHRDPASPRCAVIHDDGEKFGVWPETHTSVYEKGWLAEFFQGLLNERDWLRCATYSEYMADAGALGRTYLTCASYEEMMEWALPPSMQRRLKRLKDEAAADPERAEELALFTRGGFWRNFMAKYDESNNMQKKMLFVSRKIAKVPKSKQDGAYEEARRLLHEGQCNCAYWHGVFGGLYLNHLRTAVYDRLISAEKAVDSLTRRGTQWGASHVLDFDADGHDEVILENARASLGFSPRDGGTLFELDYKDKPFNFCNTLMRRDETYHDTLREGLPQEADGGGHSIHEIVRAKEAGLEAYLVEDPYRRASLRDHFLDAGVTPQDLRACAFEERGDFATGMYMAATKQRSASFTREGWVTRAEGQSVAVRLTKTVQLPRDASAFQIRYAIENLSDNELDTVFAVEFGVNLLTGSSPDRYYCSDDANLNSAQLGVLTRWDNLTHIALRDDWQRLGLSIRMDRAAAVYCFPIETVSQSEGGQERIYQGSAVLPSWPLRIPPGKQAALGLTVEMTDTGADN